MLACRGVVVALVAAMALTTWYGVDSLEVVRVGSTADHARRRQKNTRDVDPAWLHGLQPFPPPPPRPVGVGLAPVDVVEHPEAGALVGVAGAGAPLGVAPVPPEAGALVGVAGAGAAPGVAPVSPAVALHDDEEAAMLSDSAVAHPLFRPASRPVSSGGAAVRAMAPTPHSSAAEVSAMVASEAKVGGHSAFGGKTVRVTHHARPLATETDTKTTDTGLGDGIGIDCRNEVKEVAGMMHSVSVCGHGRDATTIDTVETPTRTVVAKKTVNGPDTKVVTEDTVDAAAQPAVIKYSSPLCNEYQKTAEGDDCSTSVKEVVNPADPELRATDTEVVLTTHSRNSNTVKKETYSQRTPLDAHQIVRVTSKGGKESRTVTSMGKDGSVTTEETVPGTKTAEPSVSVKRTWAGGDTTEVRQTVGAGR